MHEWQSQSHVEWEYKYHIVIVPKYRKKLLYGKLMSTPPSRGLPEATPYGGGVFTGHW